MQRVWILAADASRARLFERSAPDQPTQEIEDLVNPAGRNRDRDLRSDAEGRYPSKGQRGQAHTSQRHVDAVDHETERFAKRVGDMLDHARALHRFDRLYLVGAPRFLGMLRKDIAKDVSRCSAREVEQVVRESIERATL